ncbi:hypothetical protein LTR49_019109 [Elasticomyces elasticus]|nr:hypothetical protein LTR49_019109 [Elasticomyces elasticus]KAK5751633.1 hypothetical protein LTS12_018245 [Elasticomyces elasticus]
MATSQPGPGKVIWTSEMRSVVWLMRNPPKLDPPARTAVFNLMFKDDLASMGLPDGVDAKRLDGQYQERTKAKRAKTWAPIITPSHSEAALREALQVRIQKAAESLEERDIAGQTPADVTAATLGMITRKRTRTNDSAARVDASDTPTPSKKRSVVSVVIAGPSTPTVGNMVKRAKQPREHATKRFTTVGGHSHWITPEEYVETQKPLIPVTKEDAFPPLTGSLLFRYWDSKSQCPLVDGGFKSNRFAKRNLTPPPLPELDSIYFPWDDILAHLDHGETESPFISTSNYLVWVLRLALKQAARGARDGRITIIDSSRLPRKDVLHITPFHNELVKKRLFTNGAWRYPGTHEFIVYTKIPVEAIVHPGVRLADLQALTDTIPVLKNALNFQVLRQSGDYRKVLRPVLSGSKIALTPAMLSAMAKLMRTLLSAAEPSEDHISHLVLDIIQGWGLLIEVKTTSEEWQQLSAYFAQVFCKGGFPDMRRQQVVRAAFLNGVRWACGPFNARFTAEGLRMAERKAAKAGLSDPMAILNDELDAAKIHTAVYFHGQRTAIENVRAQQPAKPSSSRRPTSKVVTARILDVDDSPCAGRSRAAVNPTPVSDVEQIVFEPARRRQRPVVCKVCAEKRCMRVDHIEN